MRTHASSSLRINRRRFLQSSAVLGGALMTGLRPAFAQTQAPLIKVSSRTLEVNRKAATVFQVLGPGGRSGVMAQEGERFSGTVLNASDEPLQLHYHGQIKAPFDQDRARPGGGALEPGQSDTRDFELTPGTHWMHSHSLTEQQLLAAPMVTREKDAGDVQDVVIMLHDFAFRSPQEILAELGGSDAHSGHGAPAKATGPAMPGHSMPMAHGTGHMMHGPGGMMGMTHANDVRYDAYLANDRTLDDPEVVAVDKGGRVRLRIINGGTATAFFISTPGLVSECIAVDGVGCRVVKSATYPLAQGQRIDLMVQIPAGGGAFPVLAQVEQAAFVTGLVLSTTGAAIKKLSSTGEPSKALVDLAFEEKIQAREPLIAKPADQSWMLMLGEEPGYRWTINGRSHGEHVPFQARLGQRIEMTFMNPTTMMHPMHLHGHHFQVVSIGGRRFAGALRDTLIVPAHTPVTVAFDAGQKGAWYLHCHHLYHMATGMMTEVNIS